MYYMVDKAKGTAHRMFEMEIVRVHKPKLKAYENVISLSCPKCHAELQRVSCRCPFYHYRCPNENCNAFYTLELYENNPKSTTIFPI